MPEPKDHAERRNWFETILRYVPGFRGYLEKEYRRESDELQRQWLADRLQRSKRAIDDLTRPLADAGQIDALPQVDRMRGRLDKLIARIRGAMQGYSGFFDLVRVREDLLDRIYEHDVGLMEQIDALGQAIEELPEQHDGIAARMTDLVDRIDALERQWDIRDDMLKGLE
jgi:phage shock protein A